MQTNQTITKQTTVTTFNEVMHDMLEKRSDLTEDTTVIENEYAVSCGCAFKYDEIGSLRMPIRIDCVRCGIVKRGWCKPVINLQEQRCDPGELLFVNWGAVISNDEFHPNTTFEGFVMTEEYLRKIFGKGIPTTFRNQLQCFKVKLSQEEVEIFDNYMTTLLTLIRKSPENAEAIQPLFVSVLHFVERMYNQRETPEQQPGSRRQHLVKNFLDLVTDHAVEAHDIEFYASKLFVSPHYLGTIVKQETGKPAKAWIDTATALEMKVELVYTSRPLKELADAFHFASLSSFCKYFKRIAGMSPGEFRMKMGK